MMESTADRLKVLLTEKAVVSRDCMEKTETVFNDLKRYLAGYDRKVRLQIADLDKRIKINFTDRGVFECELKVADDSLIFLLHTNSFVFDETHPLSKTGYLTVNPANAVCGMISVYNFMSDSFRYDRMGDIGQLIARMFVNREGHFYVEGVRQIGVLFNDFSKLTATTENMESFIEACVIYSLDIEVKVPPFDAMRQITVNDVVNYNMQTTVRNGSRLGFKYQSENDVS